MYRPIQYVDYQSLPGCKVSRRTSCSAKNDIFSSRYGMRKDKYGLRCGQWDDAPCHRFGTGYGGCGFTAANNEGNIRRSFSRSSNPKRTPRYHELATAKKSGCGPSCKYSRCAANDPCYAVPFYAPNERQERRVAKKIGEIPSASLLRNTCSRMAQIREMPHRVGDNMTMGVKYLQEVQDPRNLDVLPMFELSCDGNCAECSDTYREPMEEISTRTRNDTGLKSLTTKSVASNTEASCYEPEVQEVPRRALKDVNSNSTLEQFHKQTSPIPIEKTPIPTPTPTTIPRVALLRPSRPAPPQNMTKKDQQMIRYALQQERFPTPQPKHIVPLYGHEASSLPRPEDTPPPQPLYAHEAPPQPKPESPPPSSLETSTPIPLTSRRETTPRRMHPNGQKWLPGKLSPRLRTPPIVKMTYPTQTPSMSPQSHSTQQHHQSPPQKSPPLPESPQLQSHQTSPPQTSTTQQSSQALSPFTSNYESDATTTTTSNSTNSRTPTVCLCSLCGKPENASTTTTAVYKNNNNPLYDLASPVQSPGRDAQSIAAMASAPSIRVRAWALEVIVLIVLGGLVTLGLMSLVESVFGAYMAGRCGCSGGRGPGVGPLLVADGLKSGVVRWVTCPLDEGRSRLAPVR